MKENLRFQQILSKLYTTACFITNDKCYLISIYRENAWEALIEVVAQ